MTLRAIYPAAAFLGVALALPGAASAKTKQQLRASYYNMPGHRTASGQKFDPHSLTAASRTLPIGTRLRLRNPHTQQTVTVRIVDRGPWAKGRSLDVTPAVADRLGFRRAGHAILEVAEASPRAAAAKRRTRTR